MTDFNQSPKIRRSKRIEAKKIMDYLGINNSLIHKLPDDCLKHIFFFLPLFDRLRAEKVCKRWRIIGERGWNDIELLRIDRKWSDNLVHILFKRCGRFLKKLIIYDSPAHPNFLSMILKYCTLDQLEDIKIDIGVERENDECFIRNLRKLFEGTRKLAALTIIGYNIVNSIDWLNLPTPENLQKLCIEDSNSDPEDDERLSFNPDKFPNLRELELYDLEIVDEGTKRKEGSLKGLEKLIIEYCDIPENFSQRIPTFTNLRELSLESNDWLEDEHIRDIAINCDKLKDVRLINSVGLTTDCFEYLGGMLSLETLILDKFEDVNSHDLMYLVNVKCLDIVFYENTHSGDASIGLIVNSLNLEKLRLNFLHHVDISFVNDVRRIFHHGQRKKHLDLTIKCPEKGLRNHIRIVSDHPLLTVSYDTY